ncbi:hypothetical protein [Streptomyces lomondensis]|uniref:Restriction endonuclease type IV Mrr domain-containing protein n=1 Tax=Streptomyces lomondensis TaxID=68229 RepID=A0ABQ2XRX9_9ACTN|nr:hypothetical protein [Streptomyces lomondensis]MCF0080919.1 hypothetical protein [Streptomyces lomondensis]GGX31304.1 hypothetical protein GCM10010383_72080 [Streptomyces lomondensis]
MAETVPVRCPACRREHRYTAPAYPCVCGAPVAPPLDRHRAATPVAHRVWQDDWVTVRCASCGRRGEWPRPELGCPCGVVLRVPVADGDALAGQDTAATSTPAPPAPAGRPPFRSVTIRTALDAVTATALYLRWLGYRDVRRADQRPPSGIGLAARGVVAQVDPAVRPATLRDVECLWLTAMTESADCLYFSVAGYADDARARSDALGIPLFVLDLTGTPRPVNAPAHALAATGTKNRAP